MEYTSVRYECDGYIVCGVVADVDIDLLILEAIELAAKKKKE